MIDDERIKEIKDDAYWGTAQLSGYIYELLDERKQLVAIVKEARLTVDNDYDLLGGSELDRLLYEYETVKVSSE